MNYAKLREMYLLDTDVQARHATIFEKTMAASMVLHVIIGTWDQCIGIVATIVLRKQPLKALSLLTQGVDIVRVQGSLFI